MGKGSTNKWVIFIIAIFVVSGAVFLLYNSEKFGVPKNIDEQKASGLSSEIFENVNIKINKDVEFTNGWKSSLVDMDKKDAGGKYWFVQVGSLKSDPRQGIAIVFHRDKDSNKDVVDKEFLTPSKHGAIKIESPGAKDFTMSVVAEDGYKWIFNIYNGFSDNGNQ